MKPQFIVPAITLALLAIVAYTHLTVFVIQPIGGIPDGLTVVIRRRAKTNFIDSADAFCAREMGGVSLLCRAGVLSGIAGESGEEILLRMPYSDTLYLLSTGGFRYEK